MRSFVTLQLKGAYPSVKGEDAMRYAVVGGDMRFAHLVRMLQESGREAEGFLQQEAGGRNLPLEDLKKYDCIVSNYPMRWPLSSQQISQEKIMENIAPGSVLLLCGPRFPKERRWDLQYINLWEDEILLRENAWLTAEAAVGSVLGSLHGKMEKKNCLIVGYGRIGQALAQILTGMHAKVTVATGKAQKCSRIEQDGATAVMYADLKGELPGQKLIFSTPPSLVLGEEELKCVDRDAVLVDLASPPYGIDLDAAQDLQLHAVREPGLPGRWCPLSAGRAILNALIRWEEAESDDGLEK